MDRHINKYIARRGFVILTFLFLTTLVSTTVYAADSFFDDMDYFNDTLWQKSDWSNEGVFMCGWRPDHITHESSIMTITLDNQPSHGYPYTSGEYFTNESYLHGYIEGRIKFSCRESGTVASLFTYRGNPLSEIDIEILGKDPTVLWCSIHAPSGSYGDTVQLGFDASQDFHTYGFEWTPTTVKWFVDSQLVYTADGSVLPSDVPVSIMANFWNGDYVWTGPFNYPGSSLTTEYDWIKYTPLVSGIEEGKLQITNCRLENYPNPFNPSTRITYDLPSSSYVTLTIYDLLGRTIQTLVSEFQTTGSHSVNFDRGHISSGVYFYQLKAGNKFNETRKMILMR